LIRARDSGTLRAMERGRGERSGHGIAAAVVLVLAAAAAYANGLRGPFVFDDKGAILRNESIRHLGALGDVLFGGTYATVIGRPVYSLSLAVSWALSGAEVFGWHATNVAIHAAAGLALFAVVRRTLRTPLAPKAFAPDAFAFAIALLWTVHPLQTESVTYVCQRTESLAGLFVLATFWCALRGTDSPRSGAWSAAAVACCLLAMGTKESAAATPLLVLLHDRAFVAGTFREALRRRPILYAGLAATWIALGALVLSSAGRAGSAGLGSGVGVMEYAATQPGAIVTYLRLSFWPHPLVLDRGARLATSMGEIVPAALVVALLLVATIHALRARPQLAFVGAWFFLILAPSSSVVPLATQTVAEHRMYLPLAAVVTITVVAFLRLTNARPALRAAAIVVTAAALAWTTHVRNEDYKSELSLWRADVEHAPWNDRAFVNCGACLLDAGDTAGALAMFERAVALAPGAGLAHVYRANALLDLGSADEAERAFTEMLTAVPDLSAVALDGRARVRHAQGRLAEALADFDAAIRAFPGFARAYAGRAATREAMGDSSGAAADRAESERLGAK
jgi:tetratricopeptide (TPR) repeat protein